MDEFRKRYEDHNLELAGIVFNFPSGYVPEEIISKAEVKKDAQKYGWYVFENEVSYSRSYPKGAREGKPIFNTSYARGVQADRFSAFAEEFAQRISL